MADGSSLLRVDPFLKSCASFISSCHTETLPKLAVEATLYPARIGAKTSRAELEYSMVDQGGSTSDTFGSRKRQSTIIPQVKR
ncbi:hypothetical protein BM221_000357 [Beauveria bassiana]|uniref:Uncharacterized protein n=1 Tax=Beauveria bassiana TaxID=176275 RepID=A0A2N6P0B6_BEABA|nr:hypothetical protein BM221_000357 [Beauveria bassiana]